ncbi:MAG: hypothetical protein LGB73_04340, partial [Sulfurovum sp.]|nr:hypothetical protein [Sulfurovum sp.]
LDGNNNEDNKMKTILKTAATKTGAVFFAFGMFLVFCHRQPMITDPHNVYFKNINLKKLI